MSEHDLMFAANQTQMKFTDLSYAIAYVNRAFETTGTSLRIVMYNYPYYFVCSPREASKMVKQGYDMADY